MLRRAAVAVSLVVALAGCQAPLAGTGPDAAGPAAGRPGIGPSHDARPEAALSNADPEVRTITFTRGDRRLETVVVTPRASHRYPVILFGHGLHAVPQVYGELIKRWVAAGFVVAAPAFPATRFGVPKVEVRDVLNQPADLSAVLDGLLALDPADPVRRRIDAERVVVAGHSAGGITALGMLTADGPEGRDRRVDAGIILAGSALGVGQRFTGEPVPVLFVHTDDDPTVPASTARSAFRAVPWPKAFLALPGKEHVTPYMSPGDPHFATVAAVTTDFLRWSVHRDGPARERLNRTPGLTGTL